MITRRALGAFSTAALLARARSASAAAGNTLLSGLALPANLDPHQVFDVPMQGVALNAYDTLYRYEGDPPQIVPWLAESHIVSEDGLDWSFKLKPDVRFHDGSPLTAEDVVYSFRRVLALGMAPAAAFLPILKPDDVTAPDAGTVRFRLGKPYAPFFAAVPIVAIVNPRVVRAQEKNGDWGRSWLASNEAGSGAYQIDPASYRPLEKLDLRIFRDHFMGWADNPRPIEAIAMRPVQETSTRVLALLNGSIDCTDGNLPTDQAEQIQSSKIVRLAKDRQMRTFIIRMNNTKPPFDNANARRCFAHAFNYTGFIDDILGGNAVRDGTPLPDNLWGYPKDAKGYDYDLAKAKDNMARAVAEGAPMKRPVELHIQSENEQCAQAAQLFQSDLATLGINLKIIGDTWANLTSNTAKPDSTPDMWVHWVSTYFVDPENWVGQMYDSRFHGTWKASSWYRNPKVDEALRQARETVKQEDRAPLYEQATRMVMDDCVDIWIYNSVQLQGLANRVKGRRFCTVGSGAEARWMHLDA